MSFLPVTAFSMLLSRAANSTYKANVITYVQSVIQLNKGSIEWDLQGKQLTGAVLVTDDHSSVSDSTPHWTVDLYGDDAMYGVLDEPIGTLHVYQNSGFQAYATPRAKATVAFEARRAAYKAAKQIGQAVLSV